MRRNKFLGTSWVCCSLAPRRACLFSRGMFEQTDFLLAFWPPPARFVCRGKKKKISVCPVLWYHHPTYLVFRLRGGAKCCTVAAIHTGHCAWSGRCIFVLKLRAATQPATSVTPNSRAEWTHYSHTPKKIAATLWLFPELWDLVGACTCALICQHAELYQSCFLHILFFQFSAP